MKSIKDLYRNHSGKVTDKWTNYLKEYEDKLNRYQKLPIKFFEIGILNGGSLEIFAKYFLNAELILGCDIDPKCKDLHYDQKNVKVIVGDVNEEKIKNEIIKHSKFDIIIDDGSHKLSDIIIALSIFFKNLKPGGFYILEDFKFPNYYPHLYDCHEKKIDEILFCLKNKKKFNSNILDDKMIQYLIDFTEDTFLYRGLLENSDIAFIKKLN